MTVTSSRVLDQNDNEMYPIDFKTPIIIELNAINNGEVVCKSRIPPTVPDANPWTLKESYEF